MRTTDASDAIGYTAPDRLEKSEYALTSLLRPFLLYPMTSALDDVRFSHVSAGFRLHRFESARLAVDASVGLTRDEASRNVDGAAGEELGAIGTIGAAAIPIQASLEAGAFVFAGVYLKFTCEQPPLSGDLLLRRHERRDRRRHGLIQVHDVVGRKFCKLRCRRGR